MVHVDLCATLVLQKRQMRTATCDVGALKVTDYRRIFGIYPIVRIKWRLLNQASTFLPL